jgi:23S rRNA (uracil1939-C5)-methyltransferase
MKLRIDKPIYGGAGLARHEGKAIFVPFTLPGELIEARVTQDRNTYANAELVRILEPASQRTQPQCPYFGECGGCHYQHAGYQQQLEIKAHVLRESLEREHLTDIPEIAILHAEPVEYRNRIRLHIDRNTSKLSYKRRASRQNLAIELCPIAAPVLEKALKAAQASTQAWQLGQYFREIEFFTNAAQDSILLSLWSSGTQQSVGGKLQSLWPQIQTSIPQLTGAAVYSMEQGELGRIGDQSLVYSAAGHGYRVSLGSFFQVNRFLVDPLVEHVTKAASGTLAWDLYAGVGLFSVALSSHFDQVVAVESAPSSIRDLRHNLQGKQHRIVGSSTLDFLRRAGTGKEKTPDLVIVDPPRAGLGKEVTTLLSTIRPPHITYVSCDPATLSRDLKSLLHSGYHLSTMRMVDLFPQTFHLESVATLSLK